MWVCLAAVPLSFACNKQKIHRLDYTEKTEKKELEATGLPGEGYVGSPDSASSYVEAEKKEKPAED